MTWQGLDLKTPHKINNQSSITNTKRHCISALHPWRHKFRCFTALLWTVSWHQQPLIKCSTEGVDWMEILSTDRKETILSCLFYGLCEPVVVWRLYLSGRTLAAQARRTWLRMAFHFPLFHLKNMFPSEATCSYSNQPCIWEACTENPSLELKKVD